jgi:uncharacterized protein YbaR (Trm112 family)
MSANDPKRSWWLPIRLQCGAACCAYKTVRALEMMRSSENIDTRLLSVLECPRDHSELHIESGYVCCAQGHRYPIVSGVPVFLLAEKEQTIGIATASLKAAESAIGSPLYVDTLGLSEEEKRGIERDWIAGGKIDAVISYLVGATSGWGYVNSIGKLESYPIPEIPVGNGKGEFLLDVGANWGRWSVSAARKGWRVVGIDPSFETAWPRWFVQLKFPVTCSQANKSVLHKP